MKHLLLYTISPVQTFIAQARKARDLYGGSKLLSDLIEAVITQLISSLGAENIKIIFPYKSIVQKPNRLLAEVTMDNTQKVTVTKILNEVVRNKLISIAKDVINQQNTQWNSDIENQLSDLVQAYWVMRPFGDSNYSDLYKLLETEIEGIKLNRKFNQYSDLGRKCAVSGEQNAIFFRVDNEKKLPAYTGKKLKPKMSSY